MKDRDTIIEPVIDDIDIDPDESIDDDDIVIDPDEPIDNDDIDIEPLFADMYGCPWPDEPIDPDEPIEVMYGCDWPDEPNIFGELVEVVLEPEEPIIEEVIEIVEDPMFKARALDKEEF